jgi:hypothetical protein
VEVDARRVGRVVVALCLIGLAVTGVALLVVGFHKNSQLDQLHRHGVPVTVTVEGCLGLLGGSGSNPAGYQCTGSYALDGRTFHVTIPGNSDYPPGTVIRGIAAAGDPGLFTVPSVLASQRASAAVFVLPVVLLVVAAGLVVVVVVLRRRSPDDV